MIAVTDADPVTEGHALIVTRRHTPDYLSMSAAERRDADGLMRLISKRLKARDPAIEGFNVGANCGRVAGQTVAHAHIHLIPRRQGDVQSPLGGVRGVIPRKRKPHV